MKRRWRNLPDYLLGGRMTPAERAAALRRVERTKPKTWQDFWAAWSRLAGERLPDRQERREKRPFWWHRKGCDCRKCTRATKALEHLR